MTPTVRTTQCVAQPPASPAAATPTSRCPNPGCRRPFEDCVCKGGAVPTRRLIAAGVKRGTGRLVVQAVAA